MKTVSVITPVWNRSDLTGTFLYQNSAIYAGRDTGIEWIIIDNGSTDDTAQVLTDWQTIYGDSLKIISLEENTGFGPADNLGAERATGDILAFISNDVQVRGDYITPIQMLTFDRKVLYGPEIHQHDTGWNTFDLGTIPYVAGWCVVIEASLWGPLCKWDERFVPCDYEDIDLSYQVTRAGGSLEKIKLPLIHGGRGNSGQNLEGGRAMATEVNQKRFLRKWGLVLV